MSRDNQASLYSTQLNAADWPTSWMFCLARQSDGWMMAPITFAFPQTTRASSGESVFMPTRPWHTTASGTTPRCHKASPSTSNWPGLEACKSKKQKTCLSTLVNRIFDPISWLISGLGQWVYPDDDPFWQQSRQEERLLSNHSIQTHYHLKIPAETATIRV